MDRLHSARLQSLQCPRSGAWLQAIPSKALGLHLSNVEVVTGVKLRLGMEVYDIEGPCPAARPAG